MPGGRRRRAVIGGWLPRLRVLLAVLLPTFAGLPAAASELKLATWNIEWATMRASGDPSLPPDVRTRTAADWSRLRAYALRLDADVVALQEVDGVEAAAAIFPPELYQLVFIDEDVVQRVGLAIRRTIRFTRNPDLASLDPFPQAAHRLRTGLDVTLDLPGAPLRLLAVHLKTGCRQDPFARSARPACAVLARQVPPLAGWVAARQAQGGAFALLGDFNRWMGPHDDLLEALQQAAPLLAVTQGRDSPCWGGERFIDHILLGGPARSWLQPDTLRVLTFREDESMKEQLSDHCPVSVRLRLP